MISRPFNPQYGSAVQLTLVTTAAQNFPVNPDSSSVRVLNVGAGECWFRTYNTIAAAAKASLGIATVADCRVLPGTAVVVTKDDGHDRISLVSIAGGAVEFMTGQGGV